jgi:hypothetical protein
MLDLKDMAEAFDEVQRFPLDPKVMIVGREVWDSLPEGEAKVVEFDGFRHLAVEHGGTLYLHPISEI